MSDQEQDNDFDFDNKKQGEEIPGAQEHQKIDNQHFDEAVELESENGSEIESAEEDRADQARQEKQEQDKDGSKQEGDADYNSDQSEYGGAKNQVFPGAYNAADYDNLSVSPEVKELFKYITRYKPVTLELEAKLKPFVQDYFPAIGEVDAFLKMDRPDGKEENLGIGILDEPSLNMSKQAVIEQKLRDIVGGSGGASQGPVKVHSIENADKNPKAIQSWINDLGKLRENKPQPTVPYTKQMPNIDDLMQVWPPEIEDVFKQIQLPTEELDVSTAEYARLLCGLVDIPIHESNTEKNIIEALHVAFTLYTELKGNQHLQQNQNQYDQGTQQLQL